jgi:tyrosyl-tRNA synthetase
VGDFTGIIGDTSDKDAERPMLDKETIKNNLKKLQRAGRQNNKSKKSRILF